MAFDFWHARFLGGLLWLWLLLFGNGLIVMSGLLFLFREWIKGKYYKLKYPEKVLKVIIHYRSNIYRIFWRLIPNDKMFSILGQIYNYDDKNVQREKDVFVMQKDKAVKFPHLIIDKVEYEFDEIATVKKRWDRYIEIHYWFNNPKPLDFNFSKKTIELSSSQLQSFKDNDLFAKLLTLDTEKRMMLILLLGMIVLLGLNIFQVIKALGLIG